jgi:hypothetical protein
MSEGKNSKPSGDIETVIPDRTGRDLRDKNGATDGYIRVETYEGIGTRIYVDLFDSKEKDADKAHITSESFAHSAEGADEATTFLHENGFKVTARLASSE